MTDPSGARPSADDQVELVRRGYDALSERYRGDDDPAGSYAPWTSDVIAAVGPGGRVLDLGCGNGIPVARDLVAAGLTVTGVDVSDVQVERARRLVPGATFIRDDVSDLQLEPASFDAVVAFYSLIHVPLDRQPALLAAVARWLVPNGLFVATVGHTAWTGTDEHWLGGGTTMIWSHADAATYRDWFARAGFVVEHEEFVPEGAGGHVLLRARRAVRSDATPERNSA